MSLYWLEQTLTALPLALWIYLGLGLPYALLALPRADWKERPLLLAMSFALGSALLTVWRSLDSKLGKTGAKVLPIFILR